jgi:hypothetical protein
MLSRIERRMMTSPIELDSSLPHQFAMLLLIAIPVACAAWTVTHEEVFREPREFCKRMSQDCKKLPQRKFFYLFTCEYCFSHYVAAIALWLFRYQLLYEGWRGYLVAWFAVVWIANVYMSVFNLLRLDIKQENVEIAVAQKELPTEKVVGGTPPLSK